MSVPTTPIKKEKKKKSKQKHSKTLLKIRDIELKGISEMPRISAKDNKIEIDFSNGGKIDTVTCGGNTVLSLSF